MVACGRARPSEIDEIVVVGEAAKLTDSPVDPRAIVLVVAGIDELYVPKTPAMVHWNSIGDAPATIPALVMSIAT